MYIAVRLSNGELIEFWGVRAWNVRKDDDGLWIYFIAPILPNEVNCGYIESSKVIESFVAEGGYNSVEHLAHIR